MKIEVTPEEIAALVLALQGRQPGEIKFGLDVKAASQGIFGAIRGKPGDSKD